MPFHHPASPILPLAKLQLRAGLEVTPLPQIENFKDLAHFFLRDVTILETTDIAQSIISEKMNLILLQYLAI